MQNTRPTGLLGIVWCYFAIHHSNGERRLSVRRALILGLAPILIGVLLAWKFGPPPYDRLDLIAAVFSVIAAVLLGLLPLAHGIVGQSDTLRTYTEGERPLVDQELNRIRTLQDLQVAISWAVVLLVVGLAACAALAFIPDSTGKTTPPPWAGWASIIVAVCIYGIMTSTALSFFDVATGVFEGMESHAEAIKRRIQGNIRR